MPIAALLLLAAVEGVRAQVDDDVEIGDRQDEVLMTSTSVGLGNYRLGEGVTFLSRTDSYKINLSGFVQTTAEMTRYNAVDPDREQWDRTYTRFRVRRARMRLNGYAFGGQIRYRLGIDMVKGSETSDEGGAATLSDMYIQWRPLSSKLIVSFGQRYSPADNKESFMSSLSSEFAEKSKLTSAFAVSREVGLFIEGVYKLGTSQYLKPAVSLTDGSGPVSSAARYGGLKYGARINYLPFGLFRMQGETRFGDLVYELAPKLSLGAAYSHASRNPDRRGGDGGGPYLYKSSAAAPGSGATDDFLVFPTYSKASVDLTFKYRGFFLFAEATKSWSTTPRDATYRLYADRRPTFGGFSVYDDATGALLGANPDQYIRNRMALGSAFNIQTSYMFRSMWDVALRYTHLKSDDYSYLSSKTYYGRDNWYACSLSRWLTNTYAAKIQLSYAITKPGDGYGRIVQDTVSSTGPPDSRTSFYGWENHVWLMFQLAF
ncbi:hypothetical protein FACS1894159_11400 [Bacteroidia bacterium]|nr:hypothetical protein FACS1894159_11400 [Bacteroidia bacterium]